MGFTAGAASPCCFHHAAWGVSVVVHGDDFTASRTATALDKYEAALQKSFQIKIRGRLGEEDKDQKEIRILIRIVRVIPSGVAYEAGPRHVELLAKSLGLEESKPVVTPGVKEPYDESQAGKILDEPDEIAAALNFKLRIADPAKTRGRTIQFS